jgi:hypothetical protein
MYTMFVLTHMKSKTAGTLQHWRNVAIIKWLLPYNDHDNNWTWPNAHSDNYLTELWSLLVKHEEKCKIYLYLWLHYKVLQCLMDSTKFHKYTYSAMWSLISTSSHGLQFCIVFCSYFKNYWYEKYKNLLFLYYILSKSKQNSSLCS